MGKLSSHNDFFHCNFPKDLLDWVSGGTMSSALGFDYNKWCCVFSHSVGWTGFQSEKCWLIRTEKNSAGLHATCRKKKSWWLFSWVWLLAHRDEWTMTSCSVEVPALSLHSFTVHLHCRSVKMRLIYPQTICRVTLILYLMDYNSHC